jgi:cytidylate kinase
MIIAVDGPAAAGKGTIARALAKHFGFHFLDTGSLYRMVGLAVLRAGADPEDSAAAIQAARSLRPSDYNDLELRGEEVGAAASKVAVIPEVREALLEFQRAFALRKPGAVLDGRDIGTVVCPDADVKIYVTASPEVRAQRRLKELNDRSGKFSLSEVLAEIRSRDERDSKRITAPLVAAPDAIVLDTTELDIDASIAAAIRTAAGSSAA